MIAKPFIERFRQNSGKITLQKKSDSDKFLLLFRITNQITANNEAAPKKLAEAIFRTFVTSSIIISSDSNGSLIVTQAWQNSTSSAGDVNSDTNNDLIGKPASSICDQVKSTKQIQSVKSVTQNHSNDPILQKLGAESYTGFPIFNKDNDVIAVIGLIDKQPKTYNEFELEILESITARMGREINNEPLITSHIESQINENEVTEASNTQLKAELDTANKSLESISYSISHDLRAPLRSIGSFSQLLTEEFSNNLPEEATNYLNGIRRATKRMGSMIEDLLWLSKVTRRKLEKQEIDISKVANNMLDEIKEKHIEYNCEFHSDPHLLVTADKNLIKIALQHILNNACKFSRHKDKINISLSHFEKSGETVYKISDNGCGFDMKYYDQLFEPFNRLHDDSDFEGTGIGLATVKRIIQRHGGKIWAESEVDNGTSIFFTLGAESH